MNLKCQQSSNNENVVKIVICPMDFDLIFIQLYSRGTMDDTPPEHSGFPDSRGSEIRLSGFAEFYGFCQVPVD